MWTEIRDPAQNKHAKAESFEDRRAALNIPRGWHRKSEATGNMQGKEITLNTDDGRDDDR
jgi:hypothetical protein